MSETDDFEITFPPYPHHGRPETGKKLSEPGQPTGRAAHEKQEKLARHGGQQGVAGAAGSGEAGIQDSGQKDPITENTEQTEEDGEGKSGEGRAGGAGQALRPPYRSGDWEIDLNSYTLHNLKQDFSMPLENLNSHPKYLKLFCAIGIRPEWDIQGLIGCLNWASQEVFTQKLDDMLISTVKEEGKKIDWKRGKIRTLSKPLFRG